MNFCKRSYQPILRCLYTETIKRGGEISLHKHFKLCPENECNVNDGWRTYGMKAIERVNDKCWIWKSFVEAERILKIDCHMEVVGHLREVEKAPVKMFVYYDLKASYSTTLRLYTTRKCIVVKRTTKYNASEII